MLQGSAPARVDYLLLGEHRLKDLPGKTDLYQLAYPDLPTGFRPLRGGDQAPTNLSAKLTSSVGRKAEKERILQLLVDSEQDQGLARLVTLVGPGGTGKSGLSIKTGRQLHPAFSDGVWLIELGPLMEPEASSHMPCWTC